MENFNTYQNNWNHHLLKDFFLKKGKRRFYDKKDFYIRQHEVSRLAGWSLVFFSICLLMKKELNMW